MEDKDFQEQYLYRKVPIDEVVMETMILERDSE